MSTIHQRLKQARRQAGFKTASAAIEHHGWSNSTYRAHENGQNGYRIQDAKLYAEAYGVSASWLLVGDDAAPQKDQKSAHKHNCIEHIFSAAFLLKDDPNNTQLLKKIRDCTSSQLMKISKD